MKNIWSRIDTWFFGTETELIYKYQDGTIVPNEIVSEWGIYG